MEMLVGSDVAIVRKTIIAGIIAGSKGNGHIVLPQNNYRKIGLSIVLVQFIPTANLL